MSNIKFIRVSRPYNLCIHYDVIYKSNRCRVFLDDELPKTVSQFLANAMENGYGVTQYDKTFKRYEALWFDYPRPQRSVRFDTAQM